MRHPRWMDDYSADQHISMNDWILLTVYTLVLGHSSSLILRYNPTGLLFAAESLLGMKRQLTICLVCYLSSTHISLSRIRWVCFWKAEAMSCYVVAPSAPLYLPSWGCNLCRSLVLVLCGFQMRLLLDLAATTQVMFSRHSHKASWNGPVWTFQELHFVVGYSVYLFPSINSSEDIFATHVGQSRL